MFSVGFLKRKKDTREHARIATDAGPAAKTTGVFTNLRVGIKIGIGLGVVLAFLVAVGGVSYFGLTAGDESFEHYRTLAQQTNQMGRVQANLLSARLGVKDFIIQNSENAAQVVRERVGSTKDIFTESESLFLGNENLEKIKSAQAAISNYETAFESVSDLVAERNKLVKKLNKLGRKSVSSLSRIMKSGYGDDDAASAYHSGIALRHILLARLFSSRFLVDNSKKNADRVVYEIDRFQKSAAKLIGQSDNLVRSELATRVVDLSKEYQATFDAIAANIFKRNGIIADELDVIGPKLAHDTEIIKQANKTRQDELGSKATASLSNAVLTLEGAMAAAVSLGILLAFFISRAISRPIVQMTGVMGRLANGELEAEVPARNRRDEIGSMARAVQVFKENAIGAKQLREEQARRDEAAQQEKREETLTLADDLEASVKGVVDNVAGSADEMRLTAEAMLEASAQTSSRASAVASASEEATVTAQTVASAADELSKSIEEISRQVAEATMVASDGKDQAESTNKAVKGACRRRAEDWRRGQPDQRYCRTNQSSGPERNDRSRACRRSRAWIRSGCLGGQIARQPNGESDRRHRSSNQHDARINTADDWRNRRGGRGDVAHQRDDHDGGGGSRGAERGDAGHCAEHPANRDRDTRRFDQYHRGQLGGRRIERQCRQGFKGRS